MSYETLVEQIKTLPDVYLEDISKYVQFLMYQYGHEKMSLLKESDEEFEANMNKGFTDMINGNVTPLKDAFEEIKSRFL